MPCRSRGRVPFSAHMFGVRGHCGAANMASCAADGWPAQAAALPSLSQGWLRSGTCRSLPRMPNRFMPRHSPTLSPVTIKDSPDSTIRDHRKSFGRDKKSQSARRRRWQDSKTMLSSPRIFLVMFLGLAVLQSEERRPSRLRTSNSDANVRARVPSSRGPTATRHVTRCKPPAAAATVAAASESTTVVENELYRITSPIAARR